MIAFFRLLVRTLFTNALVSALLCGPLWGLVLLILLQIWEWLLP